MKKMILKSLVLSIVLLTIMLPFSCRQEMEQASGLILTDDDDWFTNSYQNLFFDFHTQLTAGDVAKGFDASGWDDELVKNNVQAEQKGPGNPFFNRWKQAPAQGSFRMDDYIVWGGSVIRHDDGKYYMFASRWPKALTMNAWVTSSEVVLASSESPEGPYQFERVVLPRRGEEYWDGLATHNPTVQRHKGQYILFYTGIAHVVPPPLNAAPSSEDYQKAWNTKRIGVATAPSPWGPWTRMDRPIIEPRPGQWDAAITSNPSAVIHDDGSVLLMYKSCPLLYPERKAGSKLYFGLAEASAITGPYKRLNPDQPLHLESILAEMEDPYIWHANGYYHLIAKAMDDLLVSRHDGFIAWSSDGLNWRLADPPTAYDMNVVWSDGRTERLLKRERPQVLIEDGKPIMVFFATRTLEGDIFNTGMGLLSH